MVLCADVDDMIVGSEFDVCDALHASLLQAFETMQGDPSMVQYL